MVREVVAVTVPVKVSVAAADGEPVAVHDDVDSGVRDSVPEMVA